MRGAKVRFKADAFAKWLRHPMEAKAEAEEKGRTAEGRKGKLKSPFRGFRGKKAKEAKGAKEVKEAKTFHEPPPGCKPGKLNSHCFQTVAANGEIRKEKAQEVKEAKEAEGKED